MVTRIITVAEKDREMLERIRGRHPSEIELLGETPSGLQVRISDSLIRVSGSKWYWQRRVLKEVGV